MKFNQHVILKHEYGITAQWMSADWTQTAIATYQQNDIKTTKHNPDPDASIDKIYKRWTLINCSGPWTSISENNKSITIIPGYEDARNKIAGEASLLFKKKNRSVARRVSSVLAGGPWSTRDKFY